MLCSREGLVIGHEVLPFHNDSEGVLAPYRYARVSQWADDNRIAVVLNRNGDILVFRNGELRLARRRGAWCHFTHRTIISTICRNILGKAGHSDLCRAVYETSLDVSFARTGGCFAIVKDDQVNRVCSEVVEASQSVRDGTSVKARYLRTISQGPFQNISRLLRQELAGIDGAVVLDQHGNVIDIGSIVQIGGGSTGGGRLAATLQLSKHELAIKVSADGVIQGFASEEKIFEVG